MKINKSFQIGFIFGVLLFASANIISSIPDNKGFKICFDCYQTYGFPFDMYESGTMLHLNQFIWSGIVANVAVALLTSLILGLIFQFIWSKISARRTELK